MSDQGYPTHDPPKGNLAPRRNLAALFSTGRLQTEAWWVAAAYAFAATLWILFSDRALHALIADPQMLIQISVYKGLAFVMTTSLLLLILVRHYFGKIEDGYQALKAHESEIERLKRLYAALSHINQAIVRTTDRKALFQEVCEALIDHGGFRMTWIGWPEAETRRLLPVAEKGDVSGYLKNVQIFMDDRPEGRGPAGTAYREGKPCISNDLMNDPAFLPWRDEAKRRGLRASAAFPIRLKGDVCGTLTVYAGETGFFQDEETELLEEAALDISFALDNLARADERRHMEQKLRESEDAQRRLAETQIAILNALPAHITLVDTEGRIVSVNESWRRFASANLMSGNDFGVGQNYLDVCKKAHGEHSAEASVTALGIQQVLRGETREFMLDYPCHSPGEQRWFRLIVAPLHDGSREGAVVMHINITEQRKTQEALQKSEQELRLLAQQLEIERSRLVAAQQVAKVGSWDTDLCNLTVIWSEQTHRIFETDPATFRPTHADFLKLVHPDDREEVDKAFAHSLEQADVQEIQHRLLMPDGRIKHVIERWQVFHDEQGKPVRALGTCWDITEKVLAEAEIKRTTTLLQAVADGVPYAVFVKDLKSRYLLFNQGAARLAGKKIEDVVGRDDTAIFNPEEALEVMADDQRVIASGETSTREEVLTLTGKTRTFFSTKAPYWDNHGKIIGIIGISRDITQRKQAEEQMREQATLLDKAQDAIVVRDLDHRILYWNKSAERLYGWTAQEALGRSIKELLYQDPSAFLAATDATFEKGEWVGEIQQYNRDGKTLTIEGRWTLVRDDPGTAQVHPRHQHRRHGAQQAQAAVSPCSAHGEHRDARRRHRA
jgi:PAS domain S-box-containing protein